MEGSQITHNLKPVYLLASSEPLLLRDWLDAARRALREADFEDIRNQQSDTGFDWLELLDESGMMSLFSAKKCRIVTLPSGKPGQQGSKVIQRLCENVDTDNVFIFVVPALDRQARSAGWYKAIAAVGEVVELKPADQELEKLSIRFAGQDVVDFPTIEDSVARSARYSHFLLVDACLAGKTGRALKILKSLEAEGYATAQLRWALQSSLQQLDQLKQAERSGSLSERSWQQLRIWRNKQRLYQRALSRLGGAQIERLLQSCATLDRLGKGQQDSEFPGQDWLEIKSLVTAFSGEW